MKAWQIIATAVALGSLASARGPQPGSPAPAAGLVPVGVARIDITPDEPIRLTGYGNRTAPSDGVEGRLWAKALAFGGDADTPSVLITADLIGVSRAMSDEVAGRLTGAGLDRAHVAIAATHTHTGPSLTGVLPFIFSTPPTPGEQAVIERYTRQLVDRLERVARDALADRRPARLAWGQGRAGFAANRRVLKEGKWIGFGVTPSGAVDHDLPVLTVSSPDGRLRAILTGYACHATTLEGKHNVVHGDWPGLAQTLLEEQHPGAIAMVTIGTGADANPNPRGGGLADVERHAREIAGEVGRVLRDPMTPLTQPPAGRFRSIDLAFAALPSRADWEAHATREGADGHFARAMLARIDRGEPVPRTVPYPVQVWTFGDALAAVFLAGEVVADYGLRLKRERDGTRLWVNAYSNDVAFYVPSRRMIPEGGYEVDRSMVYYGQPAPLAEGTEDQIVRAVGELLPSGFARR
jgi:neutral ceramidase